MTATEFALSGCSNQHSKFTFKNGAVAYGVIAPMFPSEPNTYYLVHSNNMIAFKNAIDVNETNKAKQLCEKVNLNDLLKATLLLEIQKLTCPDCGASFEFDPNANQQVITSLNESYRPQINKVLGVTAYLTCPKGHRNPYKVKKQY
jgi:hypothetical protein